MQIEIGGDRLRPDREAAAAPVVRNLQVRDDQRVDEEAWWVKVGTPPLWGGLSRAPEATASFRAAQALLRGA